MHPPFLLSREPLPQVSREVGIHVDVMGALHLPQVAAVAHRHHAVDAEELHMLRQELPPTTLLLVQLGRPLDQGFMLQIPDLGWEGTKGMAGASEDLRSLVHRGTFLNPPWSSQK